MPDPRGQGPTLAAVDIAWLASDAGRATIAAAGRLLAAGDPLAATTALRRSHPDLSAQQCADALTQARLQARAQARLGADADRLLLTADGLEQATRTAVATLRATRLADLLHRMHPDREPVVADLGCGLGTESWALARAGCHVVAVDIDSSVAALARANATALGLADRIEVLTGDVTAPEVLASVLDRVDAVVIDPARRDEHAPRRADGSAARRILDPTQWSPPWSFVLQVATQRPTVAKVAPGLDMSWVRASGAHVIFTSHDGDLVEAALWFPPVGSAGQRTGQVVRGTMSMTLSSDAPRPDDIPVGPVAAYILDPDDALVRADVLHLICQRDGHLLDPQIAYITRMQAPDAGEMWLGRWYRVLTSTPFNIRTLRWAMSEHGIGALTITKRGFAGDIDQIRRQLKPSGTGREAVLMLTRTSEGPLAILAESMVRPNGA